MEHVTRLAATDDPEPPLEVPGLNREQAEGCLELARFMSDPHAARILRSAAARHFEQTSELEKLTVDSPSIAPEK
jgi:hypothetical protein